MSSTNNGTKTAPAVSSGVSEFPAVNKVTVREWVVATLVSCSGEVEAAVIRATWRTTTRSQWGRNLMSWAVDLPGVSRV